MKRLSILLIIGTLIFTGCIFEPPPVFYNFTIQNKSDDTLYLELEKQGVDYYNYDTLTKGETHKQTITELQCYNDYYKDTIIRNFYKRIEIKIPNKKLNINVFNRQSWKINTDLNDDNCKSGNVNLILEINNKSIH